jgi:hypothetical protein
MTAGAATGVKVATEAHKIYEMKKKKLAWVHADTMFPILE